MNMSFSYQKVLETFKKQLIAGGIPEQEAAFILGRILRKIVDDVAVHIEEVVGKSQLDALATMDEQMQQAEIARIFQEKSGQSLESYRIQVAEKLLAEYEAA